MDSRIQTRITTKEHIQEMQHKVKQLQEQKNGRGLAFNYPATSTIVNHTSATTAKGGSTDGR
jgi:hypothetical protein